jgi:hypothetical protein
MTWRVRLTVRLGPIPLAPAPMQRFAFGPANDDEYQGEKDQRGQEQARMYGWGDDNGTRAN